MKNITRFYAAITVILMLVGFAPQASALVFYSAGALLNPGDVATTTIRDYSVTPSKIASALPFTFASSTINSLNSLTLNVNATTTLNATTTIAASGTTTAALILNTQAYRFPPSQGASSTVLLTDGKGDLTWGTSGGTGQSFITSSNSSCSGSGQAACTLTETCTGGLVVSGGGGQISGGSQGFRFIDQTYPSATNAWTVESSEAGAGATYTLTAWAVCVNP